MRGAKRDADATTDSAPLDGDAMAGLSDHMKETDTYLLESIGGDMARYVRHAVAATTEQPCFGVNDAYGSFLIFNKLYGQSVVVPVRSSATGETESFHLFSTFHTSKHVGLLDPVNFIYEPTYGGLTDMGVDPKRAPEHLFMPRPLLMCRRTQDVIAHAGSDFGWRSLLYENKGEDDPYPTGIVALEGWLFELAETEVMGPSGKAHSMKVGVDCTDLDEYKRRLDAIVEYAKSRTNVHVVDVATVLPGLVAEFGGGATEGAFARREPTVKDADEDEMEKDN
jgi:hypothetical protein